MLEQYGQRIMDKPEGMLRAVHFPSLATMEKRTGDGRKLLRDGRGVRELPRTIFSQPAQSFGHEGSVPVGRLDAVQFHDDGNVEGWGWIINTPAGVEAALHIMTQVQFHNSIDLAEIKARLDIEEDENGEYALIIDFTEWKIAATTLVGKPAFADAKAELIDELTASLHADDTPLEWDVGSFEIRTNAIESELVASMTATDNGTLVAWADFHLPETDAPQKIVVNGDGVVYGHLGLWDMPDDVNLSIRVPRPSDGYASFNQAGPLTELGQVETGPIFFKGGHPDKPLAGRDPYEAYGGIENCWADVRVTAGKFGPWLSGRVRPGVSDDVVYAARASRISGHWVGDKLRAIVSVNVPRFNVAGSGQLADTSTSFAEATYDESGKMLELVASFPSFLEQPAEEEAVEESTEELAIEAAAMEETEAAEAAALEADVLLLELDLDDD